MKRAHQIEVSKPLAFWLISLALVALAVVLLHQVLTPFVVGLALAYLLDPPVNCLERLRMNRAAATLLILGLFILIVTTLLLYGIPIIGAEIADLIEKLPVYVKRVQTLVADPSHPWVGKIIGGGLRNVEQSSDELTRMGAGWLPGILNSVWSDGRALISVFSLLVVTPVVTAYLVYDWNRIIAALDELIPLAQRDTVRTLACEIDKKIAGYLRGQAIICLALGAYYVIALRTIGLNHALLIGLVTGLIGFVPYLGSFTGLVLSVSVAIVQFGPTWTPIFVIAGVFFVGQSLADYTLAPYFVGSKLHLNPVWLIFALFAFGYLFGLVGLLVAVPLAASIGVIARFALKQSLAGSSDTDDPADLRLNGDTSKLPSATSSG